MMGSENGYRSTRRAAKLEQELLKSRTMDRQPEIDGYEAVASSSFMLALFSVFLDLISSIPLMDRPLRILDVGGVEAYWSDKRKLIARPTEITLVNLDREPPSTKPGFVYLKGN